jgi:RimJ/RimL family protein N-acetyltransferase
MSNFWQGARIKLRGIELSDAEVFYQWNQDSEMSRYLDFVWPPTSRAYVQQGIERDATTRPTHDEYNWAIEDTSGELVGSIGTHHCNPRTGTFMYGVAVRREHQRRGYASEAILLVLRYFFEELRYQKVTASVYSGNRASIRLHERLGFQLEGRLRRMVFTRGQYQDELYYGMTLEEFRARHTQKDEKPVLANGKE